MKNVSILVCAAVCMLMLLAPGGQDGEVQAGSRIKTMIVVANHGTPPADFPRNERAEFSMLNAKDQRGELDAKSKQRLEELSKKMRAWPRSEKNDPYLKSTHELAAAMKKKMGCEVLVGYNDFCDPSVEDVCNRAAELGAKRVFVITPMIMAGGKHSEIDIPGQMHSAAQKHPDVQFIYVWPVPMQDIVEFLSGQIQKKQNSF
jgi:sirohydrochlorin ferrochelatase